MAAPSRFDVVLDGVGGDTEQWAIGLLKPWSGAKYVTLVTPLLHDTDSLGLLNGTFQAGFSLHNTAFQVVLLLFRLRAQSGPFWKNNSALRLSYFLQIALSVTVNNSRRWGRSFRDSLSFAAAAGISAASVGG